MPKKVEIGKTELVELQVGERVLELEQVAGLSALVQASILSDNIEAPHWAVLWPSARVLAAVIGVLPHLSGQRVIEIGCGLGALGLAAAARGASVIVSDLMPEGVALAKRNAERNGLEVEAIAFDWNEPPPDLGTFDGIVAADVLYEDGMLAGVLRFIRRHLSVDGTALLADPNRVMEGGVQGACRLHGLETFANVAKPGTSVVGGVTVYELRRRKPGTFAR